MADTMLHNYPASLSPALDTLIAKMTGSDVAWPELSHAGWHAVGYALSQVDKHGVSSSGPPPVGRSLTDGEALAELQKLKGCADAKKGVGDVGTPAWLPLALTIMQLLIKWGLGQ